MQAVVDDDDGSGEVSGVKRSSTAASVQFSSDFDADDAGVTMTKSRSVSDDQPADSAVAEQLWNAMYLARAGESRQPVAELEDAAFKFYLPMARTLAHGVTADTEAARLRAEKAAEIGLSYSVLGWRQRSSAGFRRFARSTILCQLLLR